MFEYFGDYMFSLLAGPLKRGKKALNQFYIFFKITGKLFDGVKADILRVREESTVLGASEVMLSEHGRDREMPRLKGETAEAYRQRLCMKAAIAEKAGTREGVLLAVKALGYDQAAIEPCYLTEPDKWAEFWVCLRGTIPSGIDDILIIDGEVRKVKEASAKPRYMMERVNSSGNPHSSAWTRQEFDYGCRSGGYSHMGAFTRQQFEFGKAG